MTEYRALASFTPPASADADSGSVHLGMEFYVTSAANATKIHFYRPAGAATGSSVVGAIFRVDSESSGAMVSSVTSFTEVDGWNTATLSPPVTLTPNQRYRVVITYPQGRYATTPAFFTTGGPGGSVAITNGPLVIPTTYEATGGDQGQYIYSASATPVFPTNTFQGAVYWVDVTVDDGGVATAPTVSAGADVAAHTVSTEFARAATEAANGSTITARAWTIQSGPTGAGSTISTAAALAWTPTQAGTYILRYSATNGVGTTTDDVSITVTSVALPVVNPISEQTVDPHVNDVVTLTATASNSPTAWSWTQVSGPTVTLSGSGASRTFTAPAFYGTNSATVVLGVTATNAGGTSSQVQATVTILPTARATRVHGGQWVRSALHEATLGLGFRPLGTSPLGGTT